MTTIQATLFADHALVSRADFERLLEFARKTAEIDVQLENSELSTVEMSRMAERGGAFQFWSDAGEDIYTVEDGTPVQ